MSIASPTWTIDADFLPDTRSERPRVDDLLAALRDVTACGSSVRAHGRQMADMLVQLNKQLAARFAWEEGLGYFREAVDAAPHLTRCADQLKAEHASLLQWIGDIADEVQEWRAGGGSHRYLLLIAGRFHRFDAALAQHESAENAFVHSALQEDLGVGD